MVTNMKLYLNLGCGESGDEIVHQLFKGPSWQGIRIDDDEEVKPDLKTSMVTLQGVDEFISETYPTCSVSGIFSSHALEHLHPDDAFFALCVWREFLLTHSGTLSKLILRLPDFGAACEMVASGKGHSTMYQSPAGRITALDIIFGYSGFTKARPSMGHHWGYTRDHLERVILEAGWSSVNVVQDRTAFELYAFATP